MNRIGRLKQVIVNISVTDFLIFGILLGFVILCSLLAFVLVNMGQGVNFSAITGATVSAFAVLTVLLIAIFIRHIRDMTFFYRLVAFFIFLMICLGLFVAQWWQGPISQPGMGESIPYFFTPAVILACITMAVFVIADLPSIIFWEMFFLIVAAVFSSVIYPKGLQFLFGSTIGYLILAALIFGLAFFPRKLQLKQYFWPRSALMTYVPEKKDEKGFTLIELLIVIAILGILSTGLFHIWGYCILAQKEMEERIRIEKIMNSEMNFILSEDIPLQVSEESQPLPVSLEELDAPAGLNGMYRVEESRHEGMLEVVLQFTWEKQGQVSRNFRLTALSPSLGGNTP